MLPTLESWRSFGFPSSLSNQPDLLPSEKPHLILEKDNPVSAQYTTDPPEKTRPAVNR